MYAADVILPSGFVWPVPLFNVAPRVDDVHVAWVVVVVSVTTVVPAVPVTVPPGVMVQVVTVVAITADVPVPSAKTITPLPRTEKRTLRIAYPPHRATSRSGPITCEWIQARAVNLVKTWPRR